MNRLAHLTSSRYKLHLGLLSCTGDFIYGCFAVLLRFTSIPERGSARDTICSLLESKPIWNQPIVDSQLNNGLYIGSR